MTLKQLEYSLFFLIILFLPTQLGKHFWPEFSYVYSLPIDYLSPTIYLWDLLVLLLCVVFILSGKRINKLALNLFFVFILTQALSLFSSLANVGVGLVRLEQYFMAGLLGVYVASVKKEEVAKIIFWGFIASVLFESFLAIGQFLTGGTLGFWLLGERAFSISTPGISKFDYYGKEFLRPYATFPHPNVLAGFMVLAVIILFNIKDLLMLTHNKNLVEFFKQDKIKKYVAGVTLFAGLALLMTVSRVAIISGLVYITTFATRNRDRLLIVIGTIVLLPVLYTRFSSLLNFDNLTFIRREELTMIALSLWKTSPFLGVGLNNFIPAASDLLLAGPSRFLQPVHDVFLLALSETGLIGVLGVITLFGYPIFNLFRMPFKSFNTYPFLSLWIIIAFLSLFDHYFLTLPQGYRLLFFIWGLSMSFIETNSAHHKWYRVRII